MAGWNKKKSTSSLKWLGHVFHVSATNTFRMTMRTGEHVYYYAINHSPSGISILLCNKSQPK